MLEAQVKKEQLLKERELQAAIEKEELEVGSDGDPGDPEDDGTYDSEYDDEIFQPDDLDTVKRDIQDYMQDQSSFQKVQLVCLKLTNLSFRQYIQNKGKSIEDKVFGLQGSSSVVKDFIHRQVKVNFAKILKENPKSESLNNKLCFHL